MMNLQLGYDRDTIALSPLAAKGFCEIFEIFLALL
jgi:hypothetical protein